MMYLILIISNGGKFNMSELGRTTMIIKAKINKLLGKIEDPTEELDYSYEKQKENLEKVKKGLTDVATSKSKLIIQKNKLEKDMPLLDSQAKMHMNNGKEDLARISLDRKANTKRQVDSLISQIKGLDDNQEKLIAASKKLEMKMAELESTKETAKAQYNAAKATLSINESLSGMGDDSGNVGKALNKARDKTEQMTARSSAIGELTESGVLNDPLGNNGIDDQLSRENSASEADVEFKRLKKLKMLKDNDLNYFKV